MNSNNNNNNNNETKSNQKTNRLIHEQSPYLLQHAHNPVDWYPWGNEAFEKAKKENKPIFLSIGYSTCHWCHVQMNSSFENSQTAELMNENYVNIKVDREERPDVDRVYMSFVQATTGGGGWPLSVFLTPTLKPFFGGTYFPEEDKYGVPSFPTLLRKIQSLWRSQKDDLEERGTEIIQALDMESHKTNPSVEKQKENLLQHQADEILTEGIFKFTSKFDSEWGGFSSAPKFPRPSICNYLLKMYKRLLSSGNQNLGSFSDFSSKEKAANSILDMVCFTLHKMADGGMYDHIGGGFHRYSVDNEFHVPHFEKMLYDNAQLVSTYTDAYLIKKDPLFEQVVRETLKYIQRDMTHKEGGFFSAEDADSYETHDSTHKHEGAFYTWTKVDLFHLFSNNKELDVFSFIFDVGEDGNVKPKSDPHGEFEGKNVFIKRKTFEEAAEKYKISVKEVSDIVSKCKNIIFNERIKRPRPHLDDKVITSWNGLMISGFAKAYVVFGDESYLESAKKATEFVLSKLYNQEKGILMRSFRTETSNIEGFLVDYAFFIQGLIDLYEAIGEVKYLRLAEELQTKQIELFGSENNTGFFDTTGKDPNILLKLKEDYDGAEPSGNSVSASNLVRLSSLLNHHLFKDQAKGTIMDTIMAMKKIPISVPQMMCSLEAYTDPNFKQFIIVGDESKKDEIVKTINKIYLPNKVLIHATQGNENSGREYFISKMPFIKDTVSIENKTTVYLGNNKSNPMDSEALSLALKTL